ncbi:hypothetical protein BpHYR1_053613 [Brachionus plicatilis]|uniref:Uncharacterized protein n=1 Tax=Brachionus plicatilis TaxID=10195 RepID=A0A3M7PHF8_BRAPC|nr:hypothetical protein BpHYR1_053613 [Brachionus plicatilis]
MESEIITNLGLNNNSTKKHRNLYTVYEVGMSLANLITWRRFLLQYNLINILRNVCKSKKKLILRMTANTYR